MSKSKIMLILIFFIYSSTAFSQAIQDYIVFPAVCNIKKENTTLISLRQYQVDNKKHYLLVNPQNFQTSVYQEDELEIIPSTIETIKNEFKNTNYIKAITRAELNSEKLQNAGIASFATSQQGVCLTADLCPSVLPLEYRIFTELVQTKPIPIALAVTGDWLNNHEQDLEWLLRLEKNKKISITWINHSYNHPYDKSLPLDRNFLLEQTIDVPYEILQTEVKLFEHGITPSVFFRFPGLVSNKQIFDKVTSFGLIPIGSNAWLAKKELPENGSIILIHANGNEPLGVDIFLDLLIKRQFIFNDIKEFCRRFCE
ncbi:polysaccharide deacetylase [Candidatus Poribacteria bacterium]|nr:polysaccharide deacetylase [Candidatus Poribacteria bacterium]